MDDIEVAYAEATWDTSSFPHALTDIVKSGYRGIFARGELLESYIDRQEIFTEIITGNDIDVAGSEGTLNVLDSALIEESIQNLDLRLNFLQKCKANTIVVTDSSGFETSTIEDRLKLYSFLNEIGGIARKKGIKFCFKPLEKSVIKTKKLILEMIENTREEDVFIAYEPTTLTLMNIRPQTFLPLVVDRVGVFILSDIKIAKMKSDPNVKKVIACKIGEGLINLPLITKTMECLDYSGWVVVKQEYVKGFTAKSLLKINTDFIEEHLELII
jgi:sugar phosphate isomerase/epimerase